MQKKNFFAIFLGGDFFLQNHELRPKIESRNSRDHELWYHEMRGSLCMYVYFSRLREQCRRFLHFIFNRYFKASKSPDYSKNGPDFPHGRYFGTSTVCIPTVCIPTVSIPTVCIPTVCIPTVFIPTVCRPTVCRPTVCRPMVWFVDL